jgi:hypothetical protein
LNDDGIQAAAALSPLNVTIIAAADDVDIARSLARQLLRYRLPARLVGEPSRDGAVPRQIEQVYLNLDLPLDRSSSAAALAARYAVAVCSPSASRSKDTDTWLRQYLARHGAGRLLCYIVGGEPNATDKPGRESEEAFPAAVRFHVDASGELRSERTEPIAADHRKHGDGPNQAFLKLVAGLFAVRYAELQQRALRRKRQRVALVAAVMVAAIGYGAVLWWQQDVAQMKGRQERYAAAMHDAFAARNAHQVQAEQGAVAEARRLLAQGVTAPGLMELYEFRRKHAEPVRSQPFRGQATLLLMANSSGDAVAGVSLDSAKMTLQLLRGGVKQTIALRATAMFDGWGTEKGIEYLLALDVDEAGDVWFMEGGSQGWRLSVIEAGNDRARVVGERAGRPLAQFSNRSSLLPIAGFSPRALAAGWVAYDDNGTRWLEHLPSEQRYRYPTPAMKSAQANTSATGNESIWLSPASGETLLQSFAGDCELSRWMPSTGAVTTLNLCATGFEQIKSDRDLTWLIATYAPKGLSAHTRLVNIIDGRVLKIAELKLHGFTGTVDDFVFRAEKPLNWVLVRIDEASGRVIWRSDNAHWHAGLGRSAGAVYRNTDQAEIVMLSYDAGVELRRFPSGCVSRPVLGRAGHLHCVASDGQWWQADLREFSPQLAADLGEQVHSVAQSGADLLVVGNGADTSGVTRLGLGEERLSVGERLPFEDRCLGGLWLADEGSWFLASTRGDNGRKSDIFGVSCEADGELTIALLANENGPTLLKPQVSHPWLMSVLSMWPNQGIRGAYHAPDKFGWYLDATGSRALSRTVQALALPSGWVLLGVSVRPGHRLAALTLVHPAPPYERKLVLWDLKENVEIEVLERRKIAALDATVMVHQHGFSPDGKLFFAIEEFRDGAAIQWRHMDGGKLPDGLPVRTTAATYQLLFSESGRYLLEFSTDAGSTTGRLLELATGKWVWRGSGDLDLQIHSTLAYLRYQGQVFALGDDRQALTPAFPGEVRLRDLHPERAWAAGTCGGQVCIVDLVDGVVVFLLERALNTQSPTTLVHFSHDGKQLIYVLDGTTVVRHPL